MKRHLVCLDRIAGELNAWLLAVAIGLGMLDLTVLIVKCLPSLPGPPAAAGVDVFGRTTVPATSSQTRGVRS